MTDSIDEIKKLFEALKYDIREYINNVIVGSGQIRASTLSDITPILGLIQSFEFRTPGDPRLPTYSGIQVNESGIATFNTGAQTGSIQSDGDVFFGSDISSAATTGFLIFSQDQTYNGESMGAGDVMIGDNSSGKPNILWDKSQGQLRFRIGTNVQGFMASAGLTQIGAKMETTNRAVAAGTTIIVISHDTEVYDDANFIDLVADDTKLTIPSGQDGTYLIGVNYAMDNPGAGAYWRVRIRLNNTTTIAASIVPYTSTFVTCNMFEEYPLVAGDFITVGMTHTNAGSLNVQDGGVFIRKVR